MSAEDATCPICHGEDGLLCRRCRAARRDALDLRSADIAVHEAAVALELADTERARLIAENERLKCCGNCDEWHPSGHRCYMGDDGTVLTDRMDRCHFTPPRWSFDRVCGGFWDGSARDEATEGEVSQPVMR